MHVWQAFANPLTLLASLEGSYAPSIEHTRRLKLPIEAAVCRVEEPQQQMPQYLLIIIQQQRKLECCLHNSSTFHHHHPTSTILTYYYMSKVSWLVCAWLAVVTTFVQNARKKKILPNVDNLEIEVCKNSFHRIKID